LILSGLFAGVAPGQVVRLPAPTEARPKAALPATSEVNTPREEPVQLNAFEVASNRDYGYLATNSSTATGSRTAVRDTPMSITILTEDFLRDKNIIDVQEALRNISSMTAEGKEENIVTARRASVQTRRPKPST
jgi:outer membrane receptor for ferric coprogen and ferric-rhodotorulic acid